MEKKTVVVGMSGGVDSSVATYLLKQSGYDVIGVTMQIWQDDDTLKQEENGGCCGVSAVWDARNVAEHLDIPYYVMNFKQSFDKHVIQYFKSEYIRGRTPNPCIACNRYVKWESLLKRSLEIGADYIATGHYAKVIRLENGRFSLQKSKTSAKDQTYALYNLTQYQLEHTLMPVGEYEKEEIRQIARKIDLRIANKPDSQEICFIPDNDYAKYIEENVEHIPGAGNFVSVNGDILGKHKGIYHYTVGQRKGLGIALGYPIFVTKICPDTNEVVLGTAKELLTDKMHVDQCNFMSIEDLTGEMKIDVKIRYNHKGTSATIRKIEKDIVECIFDTPQKGVSPGQAAVFYDGDIVLGGGTII